MSSEFVQKVIDLEAPHFNEFKTTIDRKYMLYKIFRYIKQEYGFKIEKMRGSNQVLLYHNETLIYDSDNEKTLSNIANFKKFLHEQIVKLMEQKRNV